MPADHDAVGQPRLALRDGAGLVQQHDRQGRRALQGVRVAEEDPARGPAARADEDRRRRREAERAGAGDEQHRGERDRREERARLGPDDVPDDPADDADGEHDRHEDARDPVRQPLDRGLGGLRLLDQPDDLRQGGVASDGRRLDLQDALLVERAADDAVSRLLLDRDRLSRHERLVHRGRAPSAPCRPRARRLRA